MYNVVRSWRSQKSILAPSVSMEDALTKVERFIVAGDWERRKDSYLWVHPYLQMVCIESADHFDTLYLHPIRITEEETMQYTLTHALSIMDEAVQKGFTITCEPRFDHFYIEILDEVEELRRLDDFVGKRNLVVTNVQSVGFLKKGCIATYKDAPENANG